MKNIILKLVLIGDGRVGKTSIRKNYMGYGFTKSHLSTLGADFSEISNKFKFGNDEIKAKLQIWDVAGQNNFQKIRLRFLTRASAIILVYDITNMSSFQNLPNWLKEVWSVNKSKDLPILILGNKIDLEEDREVPYTLVEKFKNDLIDKLKEKVEIIHIETSALTGQNIKQGFETITLSFYKNLLKTQ